MLEVSNFLSSSSVGCLVFDHCQKQRCLSQCCQLSWYLLGYLNQVFVLLLGFFRPNNNNSHGTVGSKMVYYFFIAIPLYPVS